MSIFAQLGLVWLLAVLAQSSGWLWQQRRRNAGIVDVIWAAGVGGAAVLLAVLGAGAAWSRVTLAVLGGAWGLRLALHLWRRVRHETEDGRYAHLRTLWGDSPWRWFAFFQFQALLIVLFALPFVAAAASPLAGPHPAWIAALAIWLAGVTGESVADAQLQRFRQDPANRGRTCRAGLWRYSRHPNYFFEWLHWFAYVALAWGSPLWMLAWLGPVVMFVFLRWLSGIPFTEAQALRTRGEDYRDYMQRTPMLFPWFPRSDP
jgi:steroid 5-alpha reductase family enzyme